MATRIIKANQSSESATSEAFNLVDLRRQGDDLITSAKRQAVEIVANAQAEANLIVEQARIQAIQAGREEGLRDSATLIARRADEISEHRVSELLESALPALRTAAASLQSERDRWLIRWENTAVRLGVIIAEKLIQRQIMDHPDFATEMIADALRLAAGQEKLTVYLHPDDLAAWGDRSTQIIESLTACADAKLVADNKCLRGGCRIETRHGEIDARVETMLNRIAEELVNG